MNICQHKPKKIIYVKISDGKNKVNFEKINGAKISYLKRRLP